MKTPTASFSSNAQVKQAVMAIYHTVCTFSMSMQAMETLYDVDVAAKVRHSPALTAYGAGMLDTLIHIIGSDHTEPVYQGADGSICKGADGVSTGLRWKGTEFLFLAIGAAPCSSQ
ncbi:hypothetical protein uan_041 [Pseudomonas phage UAntarctica]|nr:hypothetical protein uan_041 [Pseudomonas phage UAntarctica]